MDAHDPAERRMAQTAAAGVFIAVSFYKNEDLVGPLVDSLIACAADIAAIGGEVLFYCDSPDHAALRAALDAALPRARAAFPCRLTVNAENLGFVRTMNLAVADAVAARRDLLLLNSDALPEPGALREMRRVLRLDHMNGFVNPRSNNATIATLPLRGAAGDLAAMRRDFAALAALLPETSYVPTAVGFCLLIAWRVLAEFGGLDEIYGKGYNEENDLVMRAGRCGFRAVLANRAFVWHEGEKSFSTAEIDRSVWEPANRAILDQRYPEYAPYTAAYYHAPGTIAEELCAALLPDAQGKLDLAFDFSSFRPAHNGTFQAGRQLLEAALRSWTDTYRLHVLCTEEVYAFHGYGALGVPRVDPHAQRRFAAIFRVGQPYDWNVLERVSVSCAVFGIYMLDTISLDCPPLASNLLHAMWQFTMDHADVVATQSRQTARHFAQRFRLAQETVHVVAPHSMDVAEYRLPGAGAPAPRTGRILVLGNHFHHKYLTPTANALAAALPERSIVALGAPRPLKLGERQEFPPVPPLAALPNLTGVPVGDMSDADMGAQYSACDAVVFPSHAEGFGFPALNALAAERPLFLRRLPVFEELYEALGQPPNMYFYDTTAELIALLRENPAWRPHAVSAPYTADDSARDIRAALEAARRGAGFTRIARRIEAVQLASAFAHDSSAPVLDSEVGRAARFAGQRVEAIARRVLSSRAAYGLTRAGWHTARTVLGTLRPRKS